MKRTLLAAAAILLLSVAAYSNSFTAAFELDDYHQIVENPYIREISNVPRFFFDPTLSTGWSSYFGAAGYRPVTHASFAVSYALSGYNVSGWHAFNLAVHFLNALLVFFIARTLLGDALRKDAFTEALLASAVFAVHPIQTGAVTYVSGRAVLLASFFCLCSFALFLRMRAAGPGDGAKKLLYGSLGPACYLLGLLSKEMAVSLPALMLGYDLLFTARRAAPVKARGIWLNYVAYLAVLLCYLGLRHSFLGYAAAPASPYGVGGYLLSEARALLIYLRVFLFPVNQNADYSLPPTGSVDAYVVASFVLVLAALAFVYRARVKAPAASFLCLWFMVALAPESTLFPIMDIAVEYRMYLPSVGIIVLAVMVGSTALRRLPRLRLPASAAVVVLLGVLTFGRNMAWATPSTFWADVLQKSPWSARARGNLGKALMDEKRYPEAVSEFVDYLQDAHGNQDTYVVLNNLGLCYAEIGKFADAERALKAARDIYPDNADAYYNLAVVYGKMGRKADEDAALRRAKGLKPSAAE